MKRILVVALEIILFFLLETTIFQWIPFIKVTPNLLLILTVSMGFMRGHISGLVVGFFSGLLLDMYFGTYMGICALIYVLIGYASGFANKIFVKEELSIPVILIGVGELGYFFLYYILEFLLRGRLNIGYYFLTIGIPRIIYTVVVGIILYKLIYKINMKLDIRKDEEV